VWIGLAKQTDPSPPLERGGPRIVDGSTLLRPRLNCRGYSHHWCSGAEPSWRMGSFRTMTPDQFLNRCKFGLPRWPGWRLGTDLEEWVPNSRATDWAG
jgi:hypothetical protein